MRFDRLKILSGNANPALAREIVARPPRAFVISLDDLDGLAPSRPAFAEWLRENYALHDTVAGMHIFLRASDRSTPPAR